MSLSGGGRRRKGHSAERKCASILRSHLPEIASEIRRGLQNRLGGDAPDVAGLPGFWPEHKCGKQPNIRAALRQAKMGAKGRAMPVAIIQDDRARDRLVCLHLTDFVRVLQSAYGYRPPLHAQLAVVEDEETR